MSSISSVTTSPPLAPPQPVEAKASDVVRDLKADNDRDDARTNPPTPPAPLPPGQGTRIDQIA